MSLTSLDPNYGLGWPFFLPDNKAVILVRSASPLFSSGAAATVTFLAAVSGEMGATLGEPSDLYIADVSST